MFKSAFVLGSAVLCAVIAGTMVLSYAPQILNRQDTVAEASATTLTRAAVGSTQNLPANDGHMTAIPKADDGHFWANAVVNHKAVHFLVDTGATVVALTPADAQRLGFDAKTLNFNREVTTANGKTLAATVTLGSVGIGQSTVHEVDALVLKEGLSTSLLGMSYLGRLSRFEATPSSLILHP